MISVDDAIQQIERSDPFVFTIETQTSLGDRKTLLDVQNVVRSFDSRYVYLEVGSHVGGSLLPHLLDPCCAAAISIDPRPESQPDERGLRFGYVQNTTSRMVTTLRNVVSEAGMGKLTTFERDASKVTVDDIGKRARLAFIDAEHTNAAVFRDFLAIQPLLEPDALVVFHDSNLIFDALTNIVTMLTRQGIRHQAMYLPDNVFVLALGELAGPAISGLAGNAFDPVTFVETARMRLNAEIAQNMMPVMAAAR